MKGTAYLGGFSSTQLSKAMKSWSLPARMFFLRLNFQELPKHKTFHYNCILRPVVHLDAKGVYDKRNDNVFTERQMRE